jgi:hypothetical protein
LRLGLVILGVFFPSLCAAGASWKKIVLPSGEKGYSVRCDEGINSCYELAGDICHRGYTIQSQNTQDGYASESGGFVGPGFTPGTAMGVASSTSKSLTETGLLIQCKDPEVTEFERMQKEKAKQKADKEEQLRSEKILLFVAGATAIAVISAILIRQANN